MSDKLDLEVIKQRTEDATDGPWRFTPEVLGIKSTTVMAGEEQVGYFSVGQAQPHDAEFIAHARQDLPALVAEVERLQGVVERVRELHRAVDIEPSETVCHECSVEMFDGHYFADAIEWPCATIRALEGK